MKNSVKLFFLLLVFMPLKKGYSQMRFYNELGASGTLGISVSFFESFGYNFHPKNKLQHCIGLFIPISWHDEIYGGIVYQFNYKPFKPLRLRFNTDFKIGTGRISYSSIFMGNIPSVILYNPFGAVLTENINIPLKSLYFKLGYGIKYTTNFKRSYFYQYMAQLCIGFKF